MEEGMTVQIKVNRIAPLVAAGAAAVAIAAAPSAAATTLATGSTVIQNPGNAEIRRARRGCIPRRPAAATIRRGYGRPDIPPWRPWGPLRTTVHSGREVLNRALSEVVPGLLELEVAVPRNRPVWHCFRGSLRVGGGGADDRTACTSPRRAASWRWGPISPLCRS